jgi:prepilin-type N-terminal cleavage/methylation domain-containing protein
LPLFKKADLCYSTIMNKHRTGFTLLELIVVIVVVGLLASLALPQLYSVVERARMAEAYVMIGTIRSAMERYYIMNNGSYSGVSIGHHGGDRCIDDWSILNIANPSCAPGSHFGYRIHDSTLYAGGPPGYYIGVSRNSYECNDCPTYNAEWFINFPLDGPVFYCGYGYYAKVYGACT